LFTIHSRVLLFIVLFCSCRPASVSIVDPPDRTLHVRPRQSFTLTCVTAWHRRHSLNDRQLHQASKRTSGSWVSPMTPGSLQWLHNGVPLTDGSSSSPRRRDDGADDVTVCRRVVITEAIDVDTGWMTSLMMCQSAGARGTGVYECLDDEGMASDNVTVNVGPEPVKGRSR
jgi:hypothetical protein